MSKVRGYLLITLTFALLLSGCAPGLAIPSPTPLPTATMTPTPTATPVPTPTSTATPSPMPTVDVASVMQRVRDLLAEAASLEDDQEFEAAQESAFQALALYLSLPEMERRPEEEVAEELLSLGQEAGAEMWVTGVALLRVEPALYLVKFGLYPIALFWGQAGTPFDYLPVTEGEAISDARLVGDEVGIIFTYIGASTVTPDFILLRREGEGWQKVWPSDPEPWRDLWITADGHLSFAAGDLSLLRAEGSSWGLSEEDPFFECHACAHRFFDVLWERKGDKYLPQVTLPLDAPYYDRLWEITQPSPYASLFDFIRRLRDGDEQGALQLASDPSVVDKAKVLGLDDPSATYMVESEPGQLEETLLFTTEDLSKEFVATFKQPSAGGHWLLTDIATQ